MYHPLKILAEFLIFPRYSVRSFISSSAGWIPLTMECPEPPETRLPAEIIAALMGQWYSPSIPSAPTPLTNPLHLGGDMGLVLTNEM